MVGQAGAVGLFLPKIAVLWHKPKSFLQLFHLVILAGNVPSAKGKKSIPLYALGHGWQCVIIFHLLGEALCLGHLEGSPCSFCKLDGVFLIQYPLKFGPPCWSLYLAGVPLDPPIAVIKGQLWCQALVSLVVTSIKHTCPGQELLHMLVQLRRVFQVLRFFCPGPQPKASGLQELPATRSWWESLLYFGFPPRAGFLKGDLLP